MNAKDFEKVAAVCEPTLSRLCGIYLPYYNASDYSVNSDRYYGFTYALFLVSNLAAQSQTIETFLNDIKALYENAKRRADMYCSYMQGQYTYSHDFEYYHAEKRVYYNVYRLVQRLVTR